MCPSVREIVEFQYRTGDAHAGRWGLQKRFEKWYRFEFDSIRSSFDMRFVPFDTAHGDRRTGYRRMSDVV
jgi:hypothetical protein